MLSKSERWQQFSLEMHVSGLLPSPSGDPPPEVSSRKLALLAPPLDASVLTVRDKMMT